MQNSLKNTPHKFPSERGKGLAGTAVIHIGLFLLLVFVAFSAPPPPQTDEGIMVNFGTGETGLGEIEPSPPAVQELTSPPVKPAAKVKAQEDPLITQNTEEAPAVKKVDPELEKKRLEKKAIDKQLKEQREAERIIKEQEETERKRVAAEQQRQTDIMNRTKNALANSKNAGTSSTSEGIAGGTGNQGVPTGSINSKVRGEGGGSGTGTGNNGISYDLAGRGFLDLPSPKYEYQGEGRVVVEVTVDRDGKVIQAVPGIKGSTTLDEYLLKVARDAAMKATFAVKKDAAIQKGSITYNFILK